MAELPPTMETLEDFVQYLASRDPISPDLMGPRSVISRLVEGNWQVDGGDPAETARPIMVRCVFPENTSSRHAVINIKLSMSGEAWAAKLYEVFDIESMGGVIVKSLSVWKEGRNPFSNASNAPNLVTRDGKRVGNFAKALELIDKTKDGVIQLKVISEEKLRSLSGVRTSGNNGRGNSQACADEVRRRSSNLR